MGMVHLKSREKSVTFYLFILLRAKYYNDRIKLIEQEQQHMYFKRSDWLERNVHIYVNYAQ